MGFYLHNVNPKLLSDDIKLLKQLYDANGEQVVYNATQSGGSINNDDNDYREYVHAKRKYLKLKQTRQTGGGSRAKNNDDKIAYLEEKSCYLQLKEIAKQRGLI